MGYHVLHKRNPGLILPTPLVIMLVLGAFAWHDLPSFSSLYRRASVSLSEMKFSEYDTISHTEVSPLIPTSKQAQDRASGGPPENVQ